MAFLLLFKFGEWGEFLLNSLYDPAGIDSIGVRTGGQGQNILTDFRYDSGINDGILHRMLNHFFLNGILGDREPIYDSSNPCVVGSENIVAINTFLIQNIYTGVPE